MKLSFIAFTEEGIALALKLADSMKATGERCTVFAPPALSELPVLPMSDGLHQWTQRQFSAADALVFIGACGIAVRAVAPFLCGKAQDPAVVVIDQKGRFAVPLVSGHIGGANALALRLAHACGAQPVITTATDLCGVFAVDTWAVAQNAAILDTDKIKLVSARLLAGEPVGFSCDFPVSDLPEGICEMAYPVGISISLDVKKLPFCDTLRIVPRCVFLGMGCRKNVSFDLVETAVLSALDIAGLPVSALAALCTVDLKAQEPAFLAFCEKYRIPLHPFSPSVLMLQRGDFSTSSFVKSVTGADNICERAAIAGAENGELILSKTVREGVTVALAKGAWKAVFPTKNDEKTDC